MRTRTVDTAHGALSCLDTGGVDTGGVDRGGAGPAVLFVHGNSSCKEIFARQLESPLAAGRRLLALDLPGHGASANAPDPERTYSIHGFADAAIALLDALAVRRAAIVGWSLGGHVALELVARWPGCVAAWITGTPPAGARDLARAFRPSPHMELTFQASFSADEARAFAQAAVGERVPLEPFMLDACLRADGRFRPLMLASAAAGRDLDGRAIAETSPLPLAVVNGGEEPFADLAFIASLAYRNLWGGRALVLDGLGHMPFWEAPARVNPLLARFLDEVCSAPTGAGVPARGDPR